MGGSSKRLERPVRGEPVRAPRTALLLVGVLVGACVGGGAAEPGADGGRTEPPDGPSTATPDERPNIVLIVTDDQRWDTLVAMPSLLREVAGRGVSFSNAFVVNPLCCPSRASILTGQYSHTTGVYTNAGGFGGFESFDDRSTLATWLQSAGYRTGLVGKYLNGYLSREGDYVPPGWDRWFALTGLKGSGGYYNYEASVDGSVESFGMDDDEYSTDRLADEALSFIRGAPSGQPLFLYFTPHAPHEPAAPAERHRGAFSDLPALRPASYNEADLSDKPAWLRDLPALTPDERRELDALRRDQFATLVAVDEAVQGILDGLEETGRLANTMVVFTSDNGFLWGEHRLTAKSAPYEESIRVPLVVRFDPLVRTPRSEDRLALNIDLAPTIAELAGLPAPDADGASLVGLLAGRPSEWRSDFLVEHKKAGSKETTTYCAVRSEEALYVYYETGEEELYDLTTDPNQLKNVAGDPASSRTLEEMRSRVSELCTPPPPGLSLP